MLISRPSSAQTAFSPTAQEMLEALGYRVLLAANGLDALRLFKANSDQVDLAVLDVVMPGLSGSETYSQMATIRPNLRVVFTTGYTSEAASLTTMIAKGAAFLQKPYGHRSIGLKIRDVLDRAISTLGKGNPDQSCSATS